MSKSNLRLFSNKYQPTQTILISTFHYHIKFSPNDVSKRILTSILTQSDEPQFFMAEKDFLWYLVYPQLTTDSQIPTCRDLYCSNNSILLPSTQIYVCCLRTRILKTKVQIQITNLPQVETTYATTLMCSTRNHDFEVVVLTKPLTLS